ncbi:VOC family protein [Fodinibius salsisoli]|uniref:VOC family protein n=1 Tax=Fodinibius salsisoli TaxID=2820877 RepID=A0ABT3PHX9_9BACT|nr:VOC family protein [Fodinibius salsisoli]MCW9705522.1 VOC family protein [Fodinibius salsisoli]
MIQANPYLTFGGNCREAMTFYQTCFGGELTFQTIAETPIADQCPEGMQDQIMHSLLSKGDFVLMATDMTQADEIITGNDMAISLNFDNEKEIKRCFDELSDGGTIIEPLEEKSWGALFGVTNDKFGKVWMLNFDKKEKHK